MLFQYLLSVETVLAVPGPVGFCLTVTRHRWGIFTLFKLATPVYYDPRFFFVRLLTTRIN